MGQSGLVGSNLCWLHPGRSVFLQGMCPMREFREYFSVVTRPVTSADEVTLMYRIPTAGQRHVGPRARKTPVSRVVPPASRGRNSHADSSRDKSPIAGLLRPRAGKRLPARAPGAGVASGHARARRGGLRGDSRVCELLGVSLGDAAAASQPGSTCLASGTPGAAVLPDSRGSGGAEQGRAAG